MTVPCLAEPAPAGDLEAAVDELRARGLRLSASRRLNGKSVAAFDVRAPAAL